MFAGLIDGKVNCLLTPTANYPNYFDKDKVDLLAIVDVIPDPFVTGLALANKNTEDDNAFINCLKRKIKTMKSEIVSRYKYLAYLYFKRNVQLRDFLFKKLACTTCTNSLSSSV